jgi:flagellar motor switch protein FliM
MGKSLSQEEIDRLLSRSGKPVEPVKEEVEQDAVHRYDFRRPDRVSKEQLHSLHFLHDRFARNVSTSISAYLRTIIEIGVVSVEQFTYSEFLMSLADPTAFYALAIPPFDDLGALEINPPVAFAMIDRILGGVGRAATPDRALTDIEQNVIDSVVKLLLDSLTEAWKPIVDLAFGIRGRETRPQMMQVAAANDAVLMVTFDMKVGESRGMANLCLPVIIVESTGSQFAQAWHRQRREPTLQEREWMQEGLARVPLQLQAMLEAQLSTREVLALAPGDVVSLGVSAQKPIDVLVGSTVKFKGRLALESGRIGVRIEQRCPTGVSGAEA